MIKKLFLTFLIYLFSFNAYCGVDFDGTDGYIKADDQLFTDYPFTYACWAKTANATIKQFLFTIADTASGVVVWRLGSDESAAAGEGVGIISARNTTDQVLKGTVLISDGAWHHFVAVFRSATDRELYIDGITDGTDADSVSYSTNVNAWDIGRTGDLTPGNHWDGQITEVAVWSASLTTTEITLLAKSKVKGMPYQIQPASLVGYWPLNDLVDGTSINAQTFINRKNPGTYDGTGSDAGGESIGKAEEVLSYPD